MWARMLVFLCCFLAGCSYRTCFIQAQIRSVQPVTGTVDVTVHLTQETNHD